MAEDLHYQFAMPADDVVRAIYRQFLHRLPNPAELEGWSTLIKRHNDPTVAIQGIMREEEYRLANPTSLRCPRLFFFHNPKAAGLSLTQAIKSAAGASGIAPTVANTLNQHQSLGGHYENFRGYEVYMGHYGRDVFEAVRDGHAYLTNFRHPVARIRSLYNHFRNSLKNHSGDNPEYEANYFCCKAATSLSFHDFVTSSHPYIRTFISDFHFRQLTGTPWEFRGADPGMDAAYAVVDGALCYYICEFEDLSQRWLRDSLGITALPRENTTYDKPTSLQADQISDESVRAILDLNQRDLALYTYAVQRLLAKN